MIFKELSGCCRRVRQRSDGGLGQGGSHGDGERKRILDSSWRQNQEWGEFPGPVVKDSVLSLQRTPVQSLVGELRSDNTCGVPPPQKKELGERHDGCKGSP